MKAKASLATYFGKRIQTIYSFFGKPQYEFSAEDFHQLRVEIKKLKTGFALLKYCIERFHFKKSFSPYKKIFKKAGRVREIQVKEKALKKYQLYKKLTIYNVRLKASYEREWLDFRDLFRSSIKDRLHENESALIELFKEVPGKCTEAYIKYLKKKIRKILENKHCPPAQLHKLRKWVKEYVYICKIHSPENKRFEISDDFQQVLGVWHDNALIADNLKATVDQRTLNAGEISILNTIRKKIEQKTNKLYNEILLTRSKVLKK